MSELTIKQIRKICKTHGGEFHGPNVEHLSIPEFCLPKLFEQVIRHATTQLESANSALRDEAKRHSEFMRGKTLVDDEMREDALRYQWLRTRAGQIGAFLWRRAPWIHEDYAENQARFDLCIDEERAEVLDQLAKEAPRQSTPTPLEQSGGNV